MGSWRPPLRRDARALALALALGLAGGCADSRADHAAEGEAAVVGGGGFGTAPGYEAPPLAELFPGTWHLSFDEVELVAERSAGEPWDAAAGLPDPYVVVQLDGQEVCSTAVDGDTVSPRWAEGCTLPLDEESAVGILIVDEDGPADEVIAAWTLGQPFCPACLGIGEARLEGDPHVLDFLLRLEQL